MILAYAYCNISVMPIRKEPSHRAEQTSQMLFGEKLEIIEINDHDWARIRCSWDDYEGWCRISQVTLISQKEFRKANKFIVTRHGGQLIFDHSELHLPLGSDLRLHKGNKIQSGYFEGSFKGRKTAVKKLSPSCDNFHHAAKAYLNAPYQWGGRSIMGIDCSGLTQMAYKLCGHKIPRDAWQQALVGETVDYLQNARCGDLAFFDNEEGKITHVGILIDETTIIHATEIAGRVVMDRIDPGGIISTTLRKRTHNLRLVKRYIK